MLSGPLKITKKRKEEINKKEMPEENKKAFPHSSLEK